MAEKEKNASEFRRWALIRTTRIEPSVPSRPAVFKAASKPAATGPPALQEVLHSSSRKPYVEHSTFLFAIARATRPRRAKQHPERTRAAAVPGRNDRVGKHRVARRARGARIGADQQVRGRLSGKALLRRLRIRR